MNVMSQTWVAIGDLTEIPVLGARCVKNGDMTIAVFRTADDQVLAIEDKCPHKNGPLSQGIVHDNCVTCPLHNWVISLETGRAQGADEGSVRVFPAKQEDGKVYLALTV
ncbi:assimilatory nitrite reductase (NAD(P)H) small subunit [Roseibium suaedae]|uniref:Assimilatory nitrite reductase (NAD(P)H) small subunit n=2 Tax=Roseibium suaedae TaxID=735517 RepID=A0A1M7PQV4_9HYPH|nr:assimilatory nitrite reductase (NAD(P)H) small subunit [Roseibium suaedae]